MAPSSLVLASSSPRRAQLLRELGFSFRRVAPEIDERPLRSETAPGYVRRLAIEKALAVAPRYPRAWVVGVDTTVVVGRAFLGKPRDRGEARRMLKRLSGRSHRVVSGIALARAEDGFLRHRTAVTTVFFRALSAKDVLWYLGTDEPLDKAGAYGIQGKGGLLIERIEGSFSNVVGFPLEKFFELWNEAGNELPA